jgi:transcriptional regulator with XRE-family HTH domain
MKNYQFNRAKIKALMAEHGHTQADLAIVVDVTVGQLSRKINGRADFRIEELLAIANHYGEHPAYFFIPSVDKVSTIQKHTEKTLTQ